MSNFSEQQEKKNESKEREKLTRENLGKFFYDLAKLTFAAMVLVGGVSLIVDEAQTHQIILLVIGAFLTSFLAYIGYRILK